MLLIQATLIIAVVGVLGLLAWIGYTIATTSVEEIEKGTMTRIETI